MELIDKLKPKSSATRVQREFIGGWVSNKTLLLYSTIQSLLIITKCTYVYASTFWNKRFIQPTLITVQETIKPS